MSGKKANVTVNPDEVRNTQCDMSVKQPLTLQRAVHIDLA